MKISSEIAGTFDVQIYNLYGQLVRKDQIELIVGENKSNLNVSELPEGSYLLQITDGEQMVSRKMVKL
jgi:hypothetical protein